MYVKDHGLCHVTWLTFNGENPQRHGVFVMEGITPMVNMRLAVIKYSHILNENTKPYAWLKALPNSL